MNRIDRLFAILLKLSGGALVRARDLAEGFELSERTIYRDMNALTETGVPIRAEAGVGYQLMPGYFVPPLLFSADEAAALTLGGRMLRDRTTGRFETALAAALRKVEAVLPRHIQRAVDDLSGIIGFTAPTTKFDLDDPQLAEIMKAIRERRLLRIRYRAYDGESASDREVEPMGLDYSPGPDVWYLNAFCRTRKAMRSFRVDRIESLKVETTRFSFRSFETSRPVDQEEKRTRVSLRVSPSAARWLRERQHWTFVEETSGDVPDEEILMHYELEDPRILVPWILYCARWIRGVDPPTMRDLVREEIDRFKNLLT